eukprot:6855439-Pyramimonas_sp.AAC.1
MSPTTTEHIRPVLHLDAHGGAPPPSTLASRAASTQRPLQMLAAPQVTHVDFNSSPRKPGARTPW